MRRWLIHAVAWTVVVGAAGCGRARQADTYIRFQVEGASYTVDSAALFVYPPSGGRRLLLLASSRFGPDPNARLGWRMPLDSVSDLAGRQVDIADADFEHDEGVLLHLSDDVDVGQTRDSQITLFVQAAQDDIVEGSFVGARFELVDLSNRQRRTTNVTGQFRARVVWR